MPFIVPETQAKTYFISEPELLLDWEKNVYHVVFRCTVTEIFDGDPSTIRKLTTYVNTESDIEKARRRLESSIRSVFDEDGADRSETWD